MAIVLYVVFVAWVFAGDMWHARGRPRITADRPLAFIRGLVASRPVRCFSLPPLCHVFCHKVLQCCLCSNCLSVSRLN